MKISPPGPKLLSLTSSSLRRLHSPPFTGKLLCTRWYSAQAKLEKTPLQSVKQEIRETLQHFLLQNHQQHHILYGPNDYTNHLAHVLLTDSALGATTQRLHDIFKSFDFLDSLPEPTKVKITEDNWLLYRGLKRHYRDYLDFYDEKIRNVGVLEVTSKYAPPLFSHFLGGALHPIIHLGFGLEFNQPLLVSEALAYASTIPSPFTSVYGLLQGASAPNQKDVSLLELIQEVHEDTEFDVPILGNPVEGLGSLVEARGSRLIEFANRWKLQDNNCSIKIAELFEAAVLLYAGTGSGRRIDFFIAHGLSSARGVNNVLPYLSKTSRIALLRSHWLAMLSLYVTSGRPKLVASSVTEYQSNISSWDECIDKGINSPDEHVPKMIRTLYMAHCDFGKNRTEYFKAAQMTIDIVKKTDDWEFQGVGNS
ncbi:hypothetical protein K7432_007626 [Basidiobolus ranarum]|uniref:Uncharacterized protein n=1 Tax=Basidiobolus ranarum TaxID=34480 RepID=A0ABR2WT78_9FUNG